MPSDDQNNGSNGSGRHQLGDDDETPTERPLPLLAEHRGYVKTLGEVIPPLHAIVSTLSEVLHELRIAREPAGRRLISAIAEAGAQLEGVGRSLKTGFDFGG